MKTTKDASALLASTILAGASMIGGAAAQSLGTFEGGTDGWWAWANEGAGGQAELSVQDGRAVVRARGNGPADAQFGRAVRLAENTTYAVSFDGWADVGRTVTVALRGDDAPAAFAWRSYAEAEVTLTPDRRRHTVLLTVPNTFANAPGDDGQVIFYVGDGASTRLHFDTIEAVPVGSGEAGASGGLNLVGPGNFDEGAQQGFFLYADHAATRGQFGLEGGALRADFAEGGTRDWHVQAMRDVALAPNAAYTLRFGADAAAARDVTVELLDADDFARYDAETVRLAAGRGDYEVRFATNGLRPGADRLAFRLGGSDVAVALDDVRLTRDGAVIANGDFSSGTDGWSAYHNAGSVELSVDGANGGTGFDGPSLLVRPRGGTGRWWDGGVFTDLSLKPDTAYEARFAVEAEGTRPRDVQVQLLDDGATWANEALAVQTGAREVRVAFETGALTGQAKLFVFVGEDDTPFRLDSVRVTERGTATTPQTPQGPAGAPGALVSADDLDRRGYAHLSGLLPDQGQMDDAVRTAYARWKSAYLHRPAQSYIDQNGGGEMLFVTGFDQNFVGRPEKGAVSEGVGYGLVITAIMDDRVAFERLWRFAETKLNGHGLMHWLYDDKGYTVDFAGGTGRVNATDGDLDAAYGLLVAAARWGAGYDEDARTLIANILEHNVTDEDRLTSGDDGYDEGAQRATLNRPLVTSYMAPGYFRLFADFTGDERWDRIADLGMAQLRANQAAVRAQNGGGGRGGDGLITFRMFADGGIDFSSGGNIYHADGARAPWRVAKDLAWYGAPQARDFMADYNGFARRQGLADLYETYDHLGNRLGSWGGTQAGWMSGPTASSMLLSDDANERRLAWDELVSSNDGSYYTASCRMLGLLTAAGWYQNPVVPR